MTPRVKICGLTRAADLELALELGATYVGFVVAADSPRRVPIDDLVALSARCAPATNPAAVPVLVSRDHAPADLIALARAAKITHVQLHGALRGDRAALAQAGLVPWVVTSLPAGATALPRADDPPSAGAPALIDVGRGGSGEAFDWRLLAPRAPAGTFIAGGIRPDNVAALLAYRPWGIDVGSGIEAQPGVKDHARMRALFAVVSATAKARTP